LKQVLFIEEEAERPLCCPRYGFYFKWLSFAGPFLTPDEEAIVREGDDEEADLQASANLLSTVHEASSFAGPASSSRINRRRTTKSKASAKPALFQGTKIQRVIALTVGESAHCTLLVFIQDSLHSVSRDALSILRQILWDDVPSTNQNLLFVAAHRPLDSLAERGLTLNHKKKSSSDTCHKKE